MRRSAMGCAIEKAFKFRSHVDRWGQGQHHLQVVVLFGNFWFRRTWSTFCVKSAPNQGWKAGWASTQRLKLRSSMLLSWSLGVLLRVFGNLYILYLRGLSVTMVGHTIGHQHSDWSWETGDFSPDVLALYYVKLICMCWGLPWLEKHFRQDWGRLTRRPAGGFQSESFLYGHAILWQLGQHCSSGSISISLLKRNGL